jgi:hypothetical protein
MSLVNWFIIVVMPGGWILVGLYKLYTMFIQRRSHDVSEINAQLSTYVMYKHGKRNRPYVGSFITLTDDTSRVIVLKDGSLDREFKC